MPVCFSIVNTRLLHFPKKTFHCILVRGRWVYIFKYFKPVSSFDKSHDHETFRTILILKRKDWPNLHISKIWMKMLPLDMEAIDLEPRSFEIFSRVHK